jgi:hypothetical protein
MKNIQVIDGAQNCSFSVYSVSEEIFSLVFLEPGQDVEFVEDLVKRLGERQAGELVMKATIRRSEKVTLNGLHGTLFFQLPERKKWYPNKRETDLDHPDLAMVLDQAGGPSSEESNN